ncbi:MAG: hypothetical protein J0L64_16380 [Acidobacteria bacterium]|nr:hypothetical protein [Acidobacteriota bacterium]
MPEAPPQQRKSSPSLWLAVVPGVLVFTGATGMFFYSSMQFGAAGSAINASDETPLESKPESSELMSCVEIYGVTMHSSESYVREMNGLPQRRPKNAPSDMSTVLRGMIRNNCGRNLGRVEVQLEVRDDEGKLGRGWVAGGRLANGQAASFEKAWMGRVTSYKVLKVR